MAAAEAVAMNGPAMADTVQPPREDGQSSQTVTGKRIDWSVQPLTAYHRLHYVCGALLLVEKGVGRMPVDYNGPEFEIDKDTCFRLVKKAMNKTNDEDVTFREIWNFVNVLYTSLKQVHDKSSPLAAALAPDPFQLADVDGEVKETMKGEIANFLTRTARDFACSGLNDQEEKGSEYPKELRSNGFFRQDLNTIWTLEAFLVSGHPCYSTKIYGTAGSAMRYLYYRAGSQKWVVDDIIAPIGSAYAASTTSSLNGVWMTSSLWTDAPWVDVVKSHQGYIVRGSKGSPNEQGASSSTLENGTYIAQPSSENVNGHTQYILDSPALKERGERRHLIFSKELDGWKICPTCGEEEGSNLAQAHGAKLPENRAWRCVPADHTDSVRFVPVTNQFTKPLSNPVQRTPQHRETDSRGEEEEEDDGDEQDDDAYDGAAEQEAAQTQLGRLIPWNERNHESLVFSNTTSTLAFFAANRERLRRRMNPYLVKFLELNKIVVGENLHQADSAKYNRLLCALTNVQRTAEESSRLLGGRFAITGDALLKFLAIVTRLKCGIPVILLGECGCGKTYSIRFLAAFLSVELYVLDVHGGTSENDVVEIVERAERYVQETGKRIMVFLDEVNACAHLGLIEECVVQRTLFGRRIDDRIYFLAALNPYREVHVDPDQDMAGLTYKGQSLATGKTKNLVYLVHPVPSALVHLAFDFGALRPSEEEYYIRSMCTSAFKDASATMPALQQAMTNEKVLETMVAWICAAQFFVRAKEKDASAASLRDAARSIQLTIWFLGLADKKVEHVSKPVMSTLNCAALGLAFAYMFRLASRKLRKEFWNAIRSNTHVSGAPYFRYRQDGVFESILASNQRGFCAKFELEPGIALNEALSENLFVTVVCILNRIPLFLVGKPGTSKTLALQIAASNLLGKSSPSPFWRRFPALAMFTYQCSPMSTAQEIRRQFDLACRFQQHASDQVSVLVLDEVGLAEFSPHLPLKILHSILVNPPVGVVGVSNWTLDRAKMNRAILLTRPEPSAFDLRFTGERISQSLNAKQANPASSEEEEEEDEAPSDKKKKSLPPGMDANPQSAEEWWLPGLAETFHAVYSSEQGDREFWGMRDYYALVRQLKMASKVDEGTLMMALCRNLGGKPELLPGIVERFMRAIFPSRYIFAPPPPAL